MSCHVADDALPARLAAFDSDEDPFADILFVCDDGAVRAHSLLFAAHSPVVREALLSPSSSSSTPSRASPLSIPLPGCRSGAVRRVRSYAYTGAADYAPSESGEMVAVASRLGISHLRSHLEADVVSRFINAETACAYFLVGRRDGASSAAVEGAAREYIRRNASACVSSPGFFELDLDSLLSLLRDDALSIREEDLFRACLSWATMRASADAKARAAKQAEAAAAAAAAAAADPLAAAEAKADAALASSSPSVWDKADPQVTKRLIRDGLLQALMPHLRFPTMGTQAFARAVVPTDALPTEDVSALLMYFLVPDVAAKSVRFPTAPRRGVGSLFTWARTTLAETGVLSLSGDRRTVHFRSAVGGGTAAAAAAAAAEGGGEGTVGGAASAPPAPSPTMLVSEQSFAGGLSTVYVTTWGCSSATVGVVVSESDFDDGDCAEMAAEHATPSSPRFEGLTLLSAPAQQLLVEPAAVASAAVAGTSAASITAATHAAYLAPCHVQDPAAAALRDGSSIVLTLDWDLHRLTVALHHKGSGAPVEVAALSGLPARPVRLALGAIARPSGGDVDGIATINSKPPAYLLQRT
jgi:hypothetical protein